MHKPFLLSAMFCFVICATALTYTDISSTQLPKTSTQEPGKNDKPAKVQGCVSAANGAFSLTDGSGTIYKLAGDASKFPEHNGHKVEVTGTIAPATSGQAESQPTLTVASIQLIAPSCHAGF
ncbi:MAG TPA: hypothetical protein VJ723_02835 [Candidatus Angelobacter sp.]|nr:hypothetical protein [Candidatus Angelobacter sp.]